MIIQHNMQGMIAQHNLNAATEKRNKAIERLSSGYKINKAGDDAAGLSISVKMRGQILGLMRSTKNTEDGISYVQVVDGAMGEVADILQRMRELGVQSLNDTNTQEDREHMQKEVEQLKKEIDKINNQTEFNSQKVFGYYDGTYYSYNGNRKWDETTTHTIDDSNNSMTISYTTQSGGEEKQIEIELENGSYTTDELLEQINQILEEQADSSVSFQVAYQDNGTCNLEMRDGAKITQVDGGLTYLFSGGYKGTEPVSLLGTTIFHPDYPLSIVTGKNDTISFDIEKYDDTVEHVDITIPQGYYTRDEMIDLLNQKLEGTGMTASTYGDYSIQVGGETGMISGLKGNMFQIDDPGSVMVSVFYDNTRYGESIETAASFQGAAVLTTSTSDTKHNKFVIDSTNNKLKMKVNASDSDPYQEITLTEGSYSVTQMVAMLQDKFDEAGFDVDVSNYSERIKTPFANTVTFAGIMIDSRLKGEDSNIVFDITASTAYETLFVKRSYNDQGSTPTVTTDYEYYRKSSIVGQAVFNDEDGLTITSDNDSFQLHMEEAEHDASTATGLKTVSSADYTISLTKKKYDSLSDLIDELNAQINSNNNLKGKVEAYAESGKICLRGTNHTISSIKVSAVANNLGYETLFEGRKVVTTSNIGSTTASQTPTLTLTASNLNNVSDSDLSSDKITIDKTNSSLHVVVNGRERTVTLDKKVYTKAELASAITEQLKRQVTESPNTFSEAARGSGPSTTQVGGKGTETTKKVKCNVTGTGKMQDGSTYIENPGPAEYTLQVALNNTTTIDASNNTFAITMNGNKYEVTLASGSYDKNALVTELNNKLKSKITKDNDGVTVSLSGNYLKFTSNKGGEHISMAFGNDGMTSSTFLDSLCTTKAAATATTTTALNSSIAVTSTNNTFSFKLNGNNVSVQLDNGTYNRSSFITQLNKKFSEKGLAVTASLSGSCLALTTQDTGKSASVYVTASDCGSAGQVMYNYQAATVTVDDYALQDSITIPTSSNEFKITIGSSTQTIKFTAGKTYTRADLVKEINNQLNGAATAKLDSTGHLTITTADKGSSAYVAVKSSDNNSDLIKAMFGTTKTVIPGVTASFDGNTLKLVGENGTTAGLGGTGKYTLQGKYVDHSLLQPNTTTTSPSQYAAYHSLDYYQLKCSNPISDDIAITADNKDLEFYYHTLNGSTKVSFNLDEKIYTRQELQTALQSKVDGILGSGELQVSVAESGITFRALKCGPSTASSGYSYSQNYYVSSSTASSTKNTMSGGFYDYVMTGAAYRTESLEPQLEQGSIEMTDTYIIGRRNVKDTITHISQGDTDSLSMDVTYTDPVTGQETVYTLTTTLDEGEYNAAELIKEIQNKLDQAVLDAGLPANSVLVDIGRFDSGVAGADDSHAINFYLNDNLKWAEGDYRIDGLRGTALPAIFFSTTGDPIPAYLLGTKDISEGVKITAANKEFSINVDGTKYTYEIPEGNYTQDEFIAKMNELFKAPDKNGNTAMIKASAYKGCFKVSYKAQGQHDISTVQGSARSSVFYEDTILNIHDSIRLQVGSNAGQEMEVSKTSVSTFRLGINTLSVAGRKSAKTALKQIDKALNYLNGKRAIYGSYENRLEHVVNGNENYAENLEDAESRIIDADMADEVLLQAKYRILQQAGISIQASANSKAENALYLLQ